MRSRITANGHELETVSQFKYLGAIINDEGSRNEILARSAQTLAALAKLKPVWRDKNIALKSKLKLVRTLVLSIFLYACESWTLTAELQRRIAALEMKCYRRILGISYTDHITNDEIRKIITQHVGHYEDLLTTVKKRKLRWYGHVTRSSGLTKTILQGTVPGKRRQGRQRKRWSDNIAEWTGKTFAETQTLAHNREDWRRLVKHSAMQRPYDPGGLREQ